MSPRDSLRVLLGGMVGAAPGHGGATWAVLQYALGLVRLGHTVMLAESVHPHDVRPCGSPLERSDNATYTEFATRSAGLVGPWALVLDGTGETAGRSYQELVDFADGADVLLNLGGALREPEVVGRVPTRIYVDLDPGFTQLWADELGLDLGLDLHSHFATYGRSLSTGATRLPTCGRSWRASAPPVVLDRWAPAAETPHSWTTVANWRSYGSLEVAGVRFGQKAHSWRALMGLPSLVDERFEVALRIDPSEHSDLEALETNGWRLVDPDVAVSTPERYRQFVRHSKAELAIAKHGYVAASTGWFSDRSACYLASGRPVVAQDTGFSAWMPTGAGLLAFSDLDGAREAVSLVSSAYERHRRAAVALAREVFDSDRVLTALLSMAQARP